MTEQMLATFEATLLHVSFSTTLLSQASWDLSPPVKPTFEQVLAHFTFS